MHGMTVKIIITIFKSTVTKIFPLPQIFKQNTAFQTHLQVKLHTWRWYEWKTFL